MLQLLAQPRQDFPNLSFLHEFTVWGGRLPQYYATSRVLTDSAARLGIISGNAGQLLQHFLLLLSRVSFVVEVDQAFGDVDFQ